MSAMNNSVVAETPPDVLAAGQAFARACAAVTPEGGNYYLSCADLSRWLLQPQLFSWIPSLMIALSVLYAIMLLVFIGLLVMRIRWGSFYLMRTETTSRGTFVVPHVINVMIVCNIVFAGLVQGLLWTMWQSATRIQFSDLIVSQVFSGLVWFPVFLYTWADLCNILVLWRDWRSAPASGHRQSHLEVRLYNVVAVGFPILLVITLATLFGLLASRGLYPTTHAITEIRDSLLELAPTWNGSVNALALVPLLPCVEQLLVGRDQATHWTRAAYCVWLGAVIVLYLLWVPLCAHHVRGILRRARMLRGTIAGLAARNRSVPASRSVPTSRPHTPGSSLGAAAAPVFVVDVNGTDAEKQRTLPASLVSSADNAELRLRWLLRVCRFRVVMAVALTIAITVFGGIVLLVVIDPGSPVRSTTSNFVARVVPLLVMLVISVPEMIAAAQHPRNAGAPPAPSLFPAGGADEKEQSGATVYVTTLKRDDVSATSTDEVSPPPSPESGRSTRAVSAISAVFHLPVVRRSPLAATTPVAQQVQVFTETKTRVDAYESCDEF